MNEQFKWGGVSSLFLNKKSEKNSLGNVVTLTEREEYVCPSDGYFNLSCNYESSSITEGYVNGVRLVILSAPTSTPMREYQNTSIFVRAGMSIMFYGGWGSFYPIV